MKKHTEEFKQEAVRIALTSGLSRRRVDVGVRLRTPDRSAARPVGECMGVVGKGAVMSCT